MLWPTVKGRDGPQQHASPSHEQDQAQDEEEMVPTAHDVLEAEFRVVSADTECCLLFRKDESGLIGCQHMPEGSAVTEFDAQQHVGSAPRDTIHHDRLADERCAASDLPGRDDARALGLGEWRPDPDTRSREDGPQLAASGPDGRLLPPDRGLSDARLLDVEQGRRKDVGCGRCRRENQRQSQDQPQ